ncbi:MAG: hypothetical protein AAGA08_17540 [Pseudomonadota bacterium]
MVFTLLAGIVIAACVFAALLWSIYRVVMTHGRLRLTYIVLALSTLLVVAAIQYNLAGISLMAGLTCAVTGVIALTHEPRWTKLLPLVQVVLGGLSVWAGASILL